MVEASFPVGIFFPCIFQVKLNILLFKDEVHSLIFCHSLTVKSNLGEKQQSPKGNNRNVKKQTKNLHLTRMSYLHLIFLEKETKH